MTESNPDYERLPENEDIEMQNRNEENRDNNQPSRYELNRRRVQRRQKIFVIFMVAAFLFYCTSIILDNYSKSVACPDCNQFCQMCNCNLINTTQVQHSNCLKCGACVNGECNNFKHDISRDFEETFHYLYLTAFLVGLCFI